MIVPSQAQVLVVAGDAVDPEMMLEALHGQTTSKRTAVVRCGAAALHFLKVCTLMPMVILLDLELPDVADLELLRRIRSDKRSAGVPVFLLAKSMSAEQKKEARFLGVNGHIIPTTDLELLSDRLTIVKHLTAPAGYSGKQLPYFCNA